MSRILPETPFLTGLLRKYGNEYVSSRFFDEHLNPLPDAPEELKKEIKLLRSESEPGLKK